VSIWEHQDWLRTSSEEVSDEYGLFPRPPQHCKFCDVLLIQLDNPVDYRIPPSNGFFEYVESLWICQNCGWWKARILRDEIAWGAPAFSYATEPAVASLRNLDLTDLTTPLTAVRDFLTANYKARFDVHPRMLEETVVSVFRDLGYKAIITAYTNDNGIDAILERGSEIIGVQVKRWKRAVKVDQIRQLAGALVFAGITKGIFVTTSRFTKGSTKLAGASHRFATPIELVDAARIYDALRIAQRSASRSFEDIGSRTVENILTTLEHPSFIELSDGRRRYIWGTSKDTPEGRIFKGTYE
jgi:restriction system protein